MAEAKVFIVGIDGGTWKVMEPLVEAGYMPTLRDLMSGGRHGILQSTVPYITCPAWNALASGRNPGWIGAFGFLNLEPASYELSYYDYHRDPDLPEIWDILGEQGLTCGVFNNPVIREPRPINGYMVPGFLADDRDFNTWPGSLRAFIDDACGGYVLEPRGFSVMKPEKAIAECEEAMARRFKAFRALLKEHPSDFVLGVFHLADRVSHSVLNSTGLPLDPRKGGLHALSASFFEKMDGYIGMLADEFVGEQDLLVVLSDHGFAPCKSGFLLNTWLVKEGYLKVKQLQGLSRMGINQMRIAATLDRFGLIKPCLRLAPRLFRDLIPKGSGDGLLASVVDYIHEDRVDWDSTLAVALPNHGIYINTSDRPRGTVGTGSEKESLIAELRGKLLGFRDPTSGDMPVSAIRSRSEMYSGPRLGRAPDLVVEMVEGWTTQAVIGDPDQLVLPLTRADHRREGMLVMRGPGVSVGSGDGCIEDIAPTVFDFLGIEEAPAMDGSSLLK